jgi:hypothetical protein
MPRIYEAIIGCYYPVKDETGQIVSKRQISKAIMLENVSGLVIGLEGRLPSIMISLKEANQIIKDNQNE